MIKMIILLIVTIAVILFLFYELSSHFKKEEREQTKEMTRLQKRGYYLTFIGACLISITLLYALVILILMILNIFSNVPSAEEGFFKLLGSMYFHSLTVLLFFHFLCYGIIINSVILYISIRFTTPTRLMENISRAVSFAIILGAFSLLTLRILNDPLVYGTETSILFSETDMAGAFSDRYEASIFKPIFTTLNIINPLLIIVGGIFLNLANRQQVKES